MGEVVNIREAAKRKKESVEQAWQRYVEAMLRSKETLRIEDGIEAGKAYREFLEMFAGRAS